jgi:hypothetical protein
VVRQALVKNANRSKWGVNLLGTLNIKTTSSASILQVLPVEPRPLTKYLKEVLDEVPCGDGKTQQTVVFFKFHDNFELQFSIALMQRSGDVVVVTIERKQAYAHSEVLQRMLFWACYCKLLALI